MESNLLKRLPVLKQQLRESEHLLYKLKENRSLISEDRFKRFSQEYQIRIEELKAKTEELLAQTEKHKFELEQKIRDVDQRLQIIDEEFQEVKLLFQKAAVSRKDYKARTKSYERERDQLKGERNKTVNQFDEISFYLTQEGKVDFKKPCLKRTSIKILGIAGGALMIIVVSFLLFFGDRHLVKDIAGNVYEFDIGLETHFTDPRDNQTYKVTEINGTVWMAENLNFETEDSWCYKNNPDYCNTYGRLYRWESALDACPPGWRLPSDSDWKSLEGTIDSEYGVGHSEWNKTGWRGSDAGRNLKSISGWQGSDNGVDIAGFSALPGGTRTFYGIFASHGKGGYWW